jgi:hypothetical protein
VFLLCWRCDSPVLRVRRLGWTQAGKFMCYDPKRFMTNRSVLGVMGLVPPVWVWVFSNLVRLNMHTTSMLWSPCTVLLPLWSSYVSEGITTCKWSSILRRHWIFWRKLPHMTGYYFCFQYLTHPLYLIWVCGFVIDTSACVLLLKCKHRLILHL